MKRASWRTIYPNQMQTAEDLERDEILKGFGYRVIRFPNTQVAEYLDIVLTENLQILEDHDWRSKQRPIIKGTSSLFSPDRGENGEEAGG
jgi:hypothetical protein